MKIPIFSFGKLTELLKCNYKLAIDSPFGMLLTMAAQPIQFRQIHYFGYFFSGRLFQL
jgi:hypothetical protein